MEITLKWKVAQARELRWWQKYLKKKDKNNYLNWKKNYWHELLDPIRKDFVLDKGNDVLDAGCGPAGIFMILDNYNVDAEDPLIDLYEEKLAHFKKVEHPRVTFFATPLENFTPAKKYQCVFSMNAINHVSDMKVAFDKLVELTKDNGYLIISIDAHNYNLFKYLLRLIPADILHPHQHDLHEYEQMFTSRNCIVVNSKLIKHEFVFSHYVIVARKEAC